MLRRIAVVGMAVALLVGVGVPAQASFFSSLLVAGTDNHFEDQSREAFVDVNKNSKVDVGDVVVGFVRIDNRTQPAPGIALNNQVYALVSQEIKAQASVAPGLSLVTFGPTTAVGLRMQDILSGVPGYVPNANDMFAVFSKNSPFSTDLIIASPGNRVGAATVTLADYIDLIKTEGTLDFTAGINTFPPDSFQALANADPGVTTDFVRDAAFSAPIGSFSACLDANTNTTGAIFQPVVACATPATGLTADRISIVGGTLFGTEAGPGGGSPAVNNNEWTNILDVDPLNANTFQCNPVGGPANGTDVCGFADKTDFVVHPLLVTPEPSSLLLLGVGLLGAAGLRRFRRPRR
jgi:hypothetical protein